MPAKGIHYRGEVAAGELVVWLIDAGDDVGVGA
jgi:hypothetical protein